jgi:S-adenosylmethionine:tRNA ribosyltransferase-isomerase
MDQKHIKRESLTLHVGAGTFKPVKSKYIIDHEMHTEHFFVTDRLLDKLILHDEPITAIGTTTVRTLESLYWLGMKLKENPNLNNFHISQWEVYENRKEISVKEALCLLREYMEKNQTDRLNASTCIMIVPGYEFKIVKKLFTNFHQPQSTLLLLIAAFIGDSWKRVYYYAMENNFRFLSYGDSSLLIP